MVIYKFDIKKYIPNYHLLISRFSKINVFNIVECTFLVTIN